MFVLSSLVTISGCQRQTPGSKKVITLTFALQQSNVTSFGYWEKIVQQFEANNPGIKINMLNIPRQYMSKIQTMIGGGSPPDLMLMSPMQLQEFVARGVILNLQDWYEKSEKIHRDDIYPELLRANRYRYSGNLHAMPVNCSPTVLYYNRDLFDAAGVSYPDESWTWETFLRAAQELTRDTDGDGRLDQYGCLALAPWLMRYCLLWQNGARLLNEEGTECLLDRPEAIEAIQWMVDLINKYRVAPSLSETREQEGGSGEMFMSGKVAMYGHVRSLIRSFREIEKFQWGIAPLPRGRQRATVLNTVCLMILRTTRYPEAAWKFVEYLASREAQIYFVREAYDLSILKGLNAAVLGDVALLGSEDNKVFLDAMSYARTMPQIKHYSEFFDAMGRELELAFLGKVSAAESCRRAAEAANEILRE